VPCSGTASSLVPGYLTDHRTHERFGEGSGFDSREPKELPPPPGPEAAGAHAYGSRTVRRARPSIPSAAPSAAPASRYCTPCERRVRVIRSCSRSRCHATVASSVSSCGRAFQPSAVNFLPGPVTVRREVRRAFGPMCVYVQVENRYRRDRILRTKSRRVFTMQRIGLLSTLSG